VASLEYLRQEMLEARRRADDKSLPAFVRHKSDAMFWHLVKRVGTLERGGMTEEPDIKYANLIGYREL